MSSEKGSASRMGGAAIVNYVSLIKRPLCRKVVYGTGINLERSKVDGGIQLFAVKRSAFQTPTPQSFRAYVQRETES